MIVQPDISHFANQFAARMLLQHKRLVYVAMECPRHCASVPKDNILSCCETMFETRTGGKSWGSPGGSFHLGACYIRGSSDKVTANTTVAYRRIVALPFDAS
jgi:hypothetical protein